MSEDTVHSLFVPTCKNIAHLYPLPDVARGMGITEL